MGCNRFRVRTPKTKRNETEHGWNDWKKNERSGWRPLFSSNANTSILKISRILSIINSTLHVFLYSELSNIQPNLVFTWVTSVFLYSELSNIQPNLVLIWVISVFLYSELSNIQPNLVFTWVTSVFLYSELSNIQPNLHEELLIVLSWPLLNCEYRNQCVISSFS